MENDLNHFPLEIAVYIYQLGFKLRRKTAPYFQLIAQSQKRNSV